MCLFDGSFAFTCLLLPNNNNNKNGFAELLQYIWGFVYFTQFNPSIQRTNAVKHTKEAKGKLIFYFGMYTKRIHTYYGLFCYCCCFFCYTQKHTTRKAKHIFHTLPTRQSVFVSTVVTNKKYQYFPYPISTIFLSCWKIEHYKNKKIFILSPLFIY